ncbi:MAG: aldehyde dehydrogenase family protein, partial [Litorimonas sp.]
STPIAEYVYKTGTDNGKRVQALGGAKNHLIVMPDANPEVVADAVIGAGYGAAGQRCMAVSVIVAVGEQTADDLVKVLAPKVAKLRVGPGDDQSSQLGPVITKASQERVKSLITSGVEDGADLILDGRDISVPGYQDGFFVGCSLFDKVKPDMAIYREEIFGPVLVIVRVKTYEEAKKLVIDHEYGNGAVIYTHDGGVARDFCQTVNIGMVGVNVPVPVPVAYHSFGGWKRSLFGDHHMHGPEGIRFNTRYKMITTRWPENESAGISFRCGTSE